MLKNENNVLASYSVKFSHLERLLCLAFSFLMFLWVCVCGEGRGVSVYVWGQVCVWGHSCTGVCWGSGLWIRTSEGVCTWVQKWWVDRNMCWQILKIVLGLWVQRKRKRWTQGQGECCVSTANHFSLASHSPKPQIPSKHPKIRREETDKCWWLRWQ